MKDIAVLFCDNEPDRHDVFLRLVVDTLKKTFHTYEVRAYHSQSYDSRYEVNYDAKLKAKGAKAAWTFLSERADWDLIISDIDFEQTYRMGSPRTGVDILRAVHNKRLRWCEMLLITRYSDEQSRELYNEIGGLMVGRHSIVNLSLSNPEENWHDIACKSVEHLADALAVREKRAEFPDVYRVRLFQSNSEEEVALTVWHRGKEVCLYKNRFAGMDGDILLALHGRQPGTRLDMNHLTRAVAKMSKARETSGGARTANNVRIRIKSIRDTFEPSDFATADSAEVRRAGKIHDGLHQEGHVCGACVLFNAKWKSLGYGFGGTSVLLKLRTADSVNDVLADPVALWARYAGEVTK